MIGEGAKFCTNCGSRINYEGQMTEAVRSGAQHEENAAAASIPVGRLNTNRTLFKYIFLSIITLGIYGIVIMSEISTDINTVAGRYDGKKTIHYCLVYFVFSWLTMGIVPLVWYHKLSNRIGAELIRRNIAYEFSASTFWGWNIVGSFIIVGPFIYAYKLLKSMNLLCEHYNENGLK